MAGFCVRDHGCKCGFTSGSGSCGDGDEKRQFFVDFQDSFHLCQRLVRFGNAGCGSFCTVHTGTAAETDDHVSAESLGFVGAVLDGIHAGFQLGFSVQLPFDAAGGQGFFEGLLDADLGQTGVGHDERFGTFEVLHFVSGFFNSAEAMHDLLDGVMHKSHCRILALLKSSYAEAGQSAALPCRRFSESKSRCLRMKASGFSILTDRTSVRRW